MTRRQISAAQLKRERLAVKKEESKAASYKAEACTSRWGYVEGTPPASWRVYYSGGLPLVLVLNFLTSCCQLNENETMGKNMFGGFWVRRGGPRLNWRWLALLFQSLEPWAGILPLPSFQKICLKNLTTYLWRPFVRKRVILCPARCFSHFKRSGSKGFG